MRHGRRAGLSVLVVTVAAAFLACSPDPPRIQDCYWYAPLPDWSTSTTTTDPSGAIPPDWTFACVDRPVPGEGPPSSTTTSTIVGYPAPVPAGTRTVK